MQLYDGLLIQESQKLISTYWHVISNLGAVYINKQNGPYKQHLGLIRQIENLCSKCLFSHNLFTVVLNMKIGFVFPLIQIVVTVDTVNTVINWVTYIEK